MGVSSLHLEFPEHLPVSAHQQSVMQAIAEHQVIIVCGETGSGKTTQLPKMLLAMGYGKINGGRLIGHTQPRRIAASSVAKRLSQELQVALGDVVGFKVRFQDRLSAQTSVKLMTDGILLAETQHDPLLKAYDALIIDEAHERSLNIDFLLGYLKKLLPQRPDLKIVITSATIDADRLAHHFTSAKGKAPIFTVSGRTYPVEIRWRPYEESQDSDLPTAILEAIDELWKGKNPDGDILVFLPGEREIRETADFLSQRLSSYPSSIELLPLLARLSSADQEKVFQSHDRPRVVLATNVAETSLTVPSIRYVIDSGMARIKRYSYRQKVEQLRVEPISQASAHQRSGRCGRVSEGVAIRLYDEKEFQARAPFTDPEILRSSLAGVILRMKALGLGAVELFPFIEAPSTRAIQDGYQLLRELGIIDERHELTNLGYDIAQWPLDPKIARMLWEAQKNNCLSEMLIIASCLSVQDVRERPLGQESKADQAHKIFEDEKSEFVSILKLWNWLHQYKGGDGHTHRLSNKQFEQGLKKQWIHVRRFREWCDTYQQLLTLVKEHGFMLNEQPAHVDVLHQTLLTGFLGHIGCRHESESHYLGPRGIKFWIHPSSNLAKKPKKWVMAAELVETSRLFARHLAHIDPLWIEKVAPHLLVKQVGDARWDKRSGRVVASEKGSLYGLVIYQQRTVDYAKIDPEKTREVFIREALVHEQIGIELAFLKENKKILYDIEKLENKSRRQDILVDEDLIYAFYQTHLPSQVLSQQSLEAWHKKASIDEKKKLIMNASFLMRHQAQSITAQRFPDLIRLGHIDCKAHYLHQPGHEKDGLSVELPLFALNQIQEDRADWLVIGMLEEKIHVLLKSLPQKVRARLIPLSEATQELGQKLAQESVFAKGPLLTCLAKEVSVKTGLEVRSHDFKIDQIPIHLRMGFILVDDETGRQLSFHRHLSEMRAQWSTQARGAFASLAQLKSSGAFESEEDFFVADQTQKPNDSAYKEEVPQHKYTRWDFGDCAQQIEIQKQGQLLIGYPAVVDHQDGVIVEIFDDPQLAAQKHLQGVLRLLLISSKESVKHFEKNIPDMNAMAMAYLPLGSAQELMRQIIQMAIKKAFLSQDIPRTALAFETCLQQGKSRLGLLIQEIARSTGAILMQYSTLQRRLKETKWPETLSKDLKSHLQVLIDAEFVIKTSPLIWPHLPRYLQAIHKRLDKYKSDPSKDEQKQKEIIPLEQHYKKLCHQRKGVLDAPMEQFAWLLQELRVSLFAQELKTAQPVSVKRLEKAWAQLNQ